MLVSWKKLWLYCFVSVVAKQTDHKLNDAAKELLKTFPHHWQDER